MTEAITKPQLARLQTLYASWEKHSLDAPGADRAARITWASQQAGRSIESFSDLTLIEAKRLIDTLQSAVGRKYPAKRHKRPGTRRSQNQGTAGRHDQIHDETTMAGPSEIAMIQKDLDRLGWDQRGLENFLRSSRSPIKPATRITTLGQANRVHWALKHMNPRQKKAAS